MPLAAEMSSCGVAKFHATLLKAVHDPSTDRIILDASKLATMNAGLVQVCVAATKWASEHSKKLEIRSFSAEVQTQLESAGISL